MYNDQWRTHASIRREGGKEPEGVKAKADIVRIITFLLLLPSKFPRPCVCVCVWWYTHIA
jgi:hypothetical protein